VQHPPLIETRNSSLSWRLILFCVLFFLIIAYCREFLLSGAEYLPGGEANHFYQVYHQSRISLEIIKQGLLPIGSFWINLYGGTPAAISQGNLLDVASILFTALFNATNQVGLSAKATVIFSLSLSVVASYILARQFLSSPESCAMFCVGYGFSAYVCNDIFWGHPASTLAVGILPLTLWAWERNFKISYQGTKTVVVAAAFLFLLFISEWYICFYALVFLALRFLHRSLKASSCKERRLLMIRSAFAFIMFALLAAPILIPFLVLYKVPSSFEETLGFGARPEFYAYRSLTPIGTPVRYQYIGATVVFLALAPLILEKDFAPPAEKSRNLPSFSQDYSFFLALTAFFVLYSAGQNGVVPVSHFVLLIFPIAAIFRFLGKSSIIATVCISLCASFGLHMALFAFLRGNSIHALSRKTLRKAIVALTLILAFLDLTQGLSPTVIAPFRPTNCHEFIKMRKGDFRVVEASGRDWAWGTSNFVSAYVGHDIAGQSPIGIRKYPDRSATWLKLYEATEGLQRNQSRVSEVQELSTVWAVKYFVVPRPSEANTSQSIYDVLTSSSNFVEVFGDGYDAVLENKGYLGMAFAIVDISRSDKITSSKLARIGYSRRDPNTIDVLVDALEPVRLVVSETYMDGWEAFESNHALHVEPFLGVCSVRVAEGLHHIQLHFKYYEQSLYLYPTFYSLLAVVILVLWKTRFRLSELRRSMPAIGSVLFTHGLLTISCGPTFFALSDSRISTFGQITVYVGFSVITLAFACLFLAKYDGTICGLRTYLDKFGRSILRLIEARVLVIAASVTSPILLFASAFFVRNVAGMWVENQLVGFIVYLSRTSIVLVWSAAIALAIAALASAIRLRDSRFLPPHVIPLTCAIAALLIASRIALESSVYVTSGIFNNSLLPIAVAVPLGSAALILQPHFELKTSRRMSSLLRHTPRSLAFLSLSSMLLTNIFSYNPEIATILGQVAFYSIIATALVHGYLHLRTESRPPTAQTRRQLFIAQELRNEGGRSTLP